MRTSAWIFMLIALWANVASGQLVDLDPDWKETEVPPPPAFRTERLVEIEMPQHVSVKFGIDPETLRVTKDGIVRYVVVVTSSSGNVSAMYEGIRCLTGEVRTYARYGASARWAPIADSQWKPLSGNQASVHALALARQGACSGRAASAQSPLEIIRRLKNPQYGQSNR